MSTPGRVQTTRVDQFFIGTEARFDRWRALLQAARAWESSMNQEQSNRRAQHEAVSSSFQELLQWEDFFAYPGQALLRALVERIDSVDATGTVRLAQSISAALLTHSYRTNLSDWESEEQSSINFGERIAGTGEEAAPHRPYFEVLFVNPARPSSWPELAQELRKLRRPQDKFVYEPVFVGNFEDAVLGAILNGSFEAVIIYEGISFASNRNSPILRDFLTSRLGTHGLGTDAARLSLKLAQSLKQFFIKSRNPWNCTLAFWTVSPTDTIPPISTTCRSMLSDPSARFMRCQSREASPFSSQIGFATWVSFTA